MERRGNGAAGRDDCQLDEFKRVADEYVLPA
jgi:hypothetical protein